MGIIDFVASTLRVTHFDAIYLLCLLGLALIAYYFLSLHQIFEAAFGAMIGLGIYVLLSVLLLGNLQLGSHGGLFPFGFSVFVISIAIYGVYVLSLLFPLHGGLIIAEPRQSTIYTLLHLFTTCFYLFAMTSIVVYMAEQAYIFKPGTIFTWLRDNPYYVNVIRNSWVYGFIMSHQDSIIPLGILLMLYKMLLSNVISAVLLSLWYNLSHVGFYRKKDDSSYRVEFHEVGGHSSGHDDHGDVHTGHDVSHGHTNESHH